MIVVIASRAGLGALERLEAAWPLISEPSFAARSRPVGLDGERLTVLVANPSMAQELHLRTPDIVRNIDLLRARLALPPLSRLVPRVAAAGEFAPPHTPPPQAPRSALVAGRSDANEHALEDALERVEDDELRALLARVARGGTEP